MMADVEKATLGDVLTHSPLFSPKQIMELIKKHYIAVTWVVAGTQPKRHTYMTWEVTLKNDLKIHGYQFQPGTLTLSTNYGTLTFFGTRHG